MFERKEIDRLLNLLNFLKSSINDEFIEIFLADEKFEKERIIRAENLKVITKLENYLRSIECA